MIRRNYTLDVSNEGDRFYKFKNRNHRLGGPAVVWFNHDWLHLLDDKFNTSITIWTDHHQFYYVNGERHRLDGPAVILANGSKSYWVNNEGMSEEEFYKNNH